LRDLEKMLTKPSREQSLKFNYEDRLLTDLQVSELAQVSINTVRYWRQCGTLHYVKVGKHPRIWLSEFNRIFNNPDTITHVGDGQRRNTDATS
jgi:hypothetical protein